MKSLHLVVLAASVIGAQCATAQDFIIRGATVHTASAKGTLKNTDVLVRGGVIVAIGSEAAAPNATVIDAKGKELTPGLFGGLTEIGIEEIGGESQTVDSTLNQKSPTWEQQWRPELDVTVAFNPRSFVVPITRVEGVTWTVLAPERRRHASLAAKVRRLRSMAATTPCCRAVVRCSCKWAAPGPRVAGRHARRGIHAAGAGHSRGSGARARSAKGACCTPPAARR